MIIAMRKLNSIDYITLWTREERYLINKFRSEYIQKLDNREVNDGQENQDDAEDDKET